MNIESVYESRFVKVYDLQYAEGAHYYDATRRNIEDIVATKSEQEFKSMLPDAVSIAVVVDTVDSPEPKLLLAREYRYPTGQFLLSPPAGLIDPEDMDKENPLYETTKREIQEETGLVMKPTDTIQVINPCLFSTPGMTDECNAMILARLHGIDVDQINQSGAVGSELFDGFVLLTKDEAREVLLRGKDDRGIFYSTYTWIALMAFVSDLWS